MHIINKPVFKMDVCKIALEWSFRDENNILDIIYKGNYVRIFRRHMKKTYSDFKNVYLLL